MDRKKVLSRLLLPLLLALLARPLHAQQTVVHLDPELTKVSFTLGDVLHTVHGTFRLQKGEMRFNTQTGEASGALIIDAKSGDSGSKARDKKMHREILESEKYPEISFIPERVIGTVPSQGTGQVQVSGKFRIHGADHPLTLVVALQVSGGNTKATTSFDVPYVAWGMKNPSTFILRVNESVRIDIQTTAQLSSQAAAAAK